jgi:hypothetical protein
MPAPTPEQRTTAELEMATEGAMMCLAARDHVEKLSDRDLVSAVEKQIWAKLGFGSQPDWLLDELINRFETQRGIKRDDAGNILPDDTARVEFMKEHTHFEFWVHHPDYNAYGGKRFNAEGVVFREVVDSAITWKAEHP